PVAQPIQPGSYVHVEKKIQRRVPQLTLECWARRWTLGGDAGLITQCDGSTAGFGLFADPDGAASFYLNDGKTGLRDGSHSSGKVSLRANRWHHLVATWDGRQKVLWLDRQCV